MTSARRLAAILAADVIGYYSRLMGANETRRANAVCERAGIYADVAEHDGRIKTTGGPHRLRRQRRVNAPAIVLFSHS